MPRNGVVWMLVGGAVVAALGLGAAGVDGDWLGATYSAAAVTACLVVAVFEVRHPRRGSGAPRSRMRWYVRLFLPLTIVALAAWESARAAGGGLEAVPWQIPATMVAVSILWLWRNDPERVR